MRLVMAVVVLLCLAVPLFAQDTAPPPAALQLTLAGPVYVAPVKGATPFVGGLLIIEPPRVPVLSAVTDWLKIGGILKTNGLSGVEGLYPALAIPVTVENSKVGFVGVTYVAGGVRTSFFAGIDLISLLGLATK